MKKALGMMAAALMASAMGGGDGLFDTGMFPSSPRSYDEMSEEERERLRQLHKIDRSEREFTIHGERITAHDRKTALKIYANRHPEVKRKQKKRK